MPAVPQVNYAATLGLRSTPSGVLMRKSKICEISQMPPTDPIAVTREEVFPTVKMQRQPPYTINPQAVGALEPAVMSTPGEKMDAASTAQPGRTIPAYCTRCKCESIFIGKKIRHWLHLLCTLFTGGIWGFAWLAILIEKDLRPWRCSKCHWHKPEFFTPWNRPQSE